MLPTWPCMPTALSRCATASLSMEVTLRRYPFPGAWHRPPPCDGPAHASFPAMRSALSNRAVTRCRRPAPLHVTGGVFESPSQHKEDVDDYHIRRIGPLGLA